MSGGIGFFGISCAFGFLGRGRQREIGDIRCDRQIRLFRSRFRKRSTVFQFIPDVFGSPVDPTTESLFEQVYFLFG